MSKRRPMRPKTLRRLKRDDPVLYALVMEHGKSADQLAQLNVRLRAWRRTVRQQKRLRVAATTRRR